jgi:hypothetical protein
MRKKNDNEDDDWTGCEVVLVYSMCLLIHGFLVEAFYCSNNHPTARTQRHDGSTWQRRVL